VKLKHFSFSNNYKMNFNPKKGDIKYSVYERGWGLPVYESAKMMEAVIHVKRRFDNDWWDYWIRCFYWDGENWIEDESKRINEVDNSGTYWDIGSD
jgi:hypothetical protein